MKYKLSLNCKTKLFEGNVESSLPIVNHPELHKRKEIRFSTLPPCHPILFHSTGGKKKISGFPREFHTYWLTFSSNTENHYQSHPAIREKMKGEKQGTLIFQKGFLKATLLEKNYPAWSQCSVNTFLKLFIQIKMCKLPEEIHFFKPRRILLLVFFRNLRLQKADFYYFNRT